MPRGAAALRLRPHVRRGRARRHPRHLIHQLAADGATFTFILTFTLTAPGGIHDVSYINWLLMVRAGASGLEFYTPLTLSLTLTLTLTQVRAGVSGLEFYTPATRAPG